MTPRQLRASRAREAAHVAAANERGEQARREGRCASCAILQHACDRCRAEKAEARVAELETAIGVATPTALRVLLELLPPEATVDRDFAQGVLDRIDRAMAKRPPAASVSTGPSREAVVEWLDRYIHDETNALGVDDRNILIEAAFVLGSRPTVTGSTTR